MKMTNKQFCENALSLIGQPYSLIDCIGVVRRAAGIACQGTNWLWRSYKNSAKYRFLTDRHEGQLPSAEAIDGTLLFKINKNEIPDGYDDKPNCYHVAILYDGQIIQSNPNTGVYISPFNPSQWQGWGRLKQVDYTVKPATTKGELSDHEMLVQIFKKICCD